MPKQRRRTKQLSEINVVPYIDVMLVLLVIFMVTAPLLSQGVKVNLPQAQAQPISSDTPEPIIVSIDAHGNYYLNTAGVPGQPLSPEELTLQVKQQLQPPPQIGAGEQEKANGNGNAATSNSTSQDSATKQRQVLVKGDKSVDYGKVVQAMVILKNAGASSVGLMTQYDSDNDGVGNHHSASAPKNAADAAAKK